MTTAARIPFRERVTCTVAEACEASGLGRTKIFEAIAGGRLEATKVDGRRLVYVPSLLRLLGAQREQRAA
jgi:excisionase family DNA binding protein